jgi:predicted SprT family Zn-dependent metalloprotease
VNPLDRLIEINNRGNELLTQYRLTHADWKFEIDNAQQRMGCCQYKRKVISFSKHFIYSDWSEIEDTLLHEVAHALVGRGHGHDEVWKSMAARLGAKPEACYTDDEVVNSAQHNYLIKCTGCPRKWKRFRLRESVRTGNARCGGCGSELEIFELEKT